ncbi:hypothetical protein Aph02nite_24340 [Actinoplanes philippinensis]|uniref:Uncharacterized protein n=1 Tax=Actinoplanes philippinensis TaxID=35752 RepID=A0A1I2G260_9ACTN|nr:DUF6461 domain-containing protein [Actinoplanes philippinensis]GIE76484.1 hypothetical protein Aph02nite_24340 [Actinoplanes philippinensis]SFF10856.1 hypothetical protein SAMN05421541_10693 [Actinoplanes philippinensis]
MVCTAADYAWFDERYGRLSRSYRLTLVADLSVAEAALRIGGTDPEVLPGSSIVDGAAPAHTVAVTETPGWALLLETAVSPGAAALPVAGLSRGTTLVAHGVAGPVSSFLWMHDATEELAFDPARPWRRTGRSADSQVGVMAEVGFPMDADGHGESPAALSLAFADYLTGVRLGPDELRSLLYLRVSVEPGPGEP